MASSSSMAAFLLFLYITVFSFPPSALSSSGSFSMCHPDSAFFRYDIQSQCPLSISPNPPFQVDGNFIEKALSASSRIGRISVLFYASQCPFSHSMLSKFETLSSTFPQIEHFVLERSSAMPSVFSRYGIHNLPAILLVNQTTSLRYRGAKDLLSLVQFYEKNTGFERVHYFADDQQCSLRSDKKTAMKSLTSSPLKEISSREPYLAFSILFICLRILLYVFPEVESRLRAFWVSYAPHLNLHIFGETSQVMGRILHVIDVRRIWTKLRLCKTRVFHERARSAQVWASSLASVSLGESSSARSSSS